MLTCSECNHNHSQHSFSSSALMNEDGDPTGQIKHLYVCNTPDCECRHEVTGASGDAKAMLQSLGVAVSN